MPNPARVPGRWLTLALAALLLLAGLPLAPPARAADPAWPH